ncbi:hypothetical protein BROUX41_006277 [Berkeleyomyces rouxiae]|uniref:uncharacterized protein n=1 Tax=Berkeleyomyces rouxiae TaxID=2035830 RepID=UPI003B7F6412
MAFSSLQKLYEESFITCSTAAHFESEGNEEQAARCWQEALSQISSNDATRHRGLEARGNPESGERDLIEALREIEYQCQQRLDFLEATRLSRRDPNSQEALMRRNTSDLNAPGPTPPQLPIHQSPSPTKQYIPAQPVAEPAFDFQFNNDAASSSSTAPQPQPQSQPQLPPRPTGCPRAVSDQPLRSTLPINDSQTQCLLQDPLDHPSPTCDADSPMDATDPLNGSNSPEKYTMRTTLRSGKPIDKPGKRPNIFKLHERPGASRAATLAWSSLTKKKSDLESPPLSAVATAPATPKGNDSTSRSPLPLHWDSHSRRLVTPRASVDKGGRRLSEDTRNSGFTSGPSMLSISAASSALNSSTSLTDGGNGKEGRSRQRPPVSNPPSSSRFIRPAFGTRQSDSEKKSRRQNSEIRRKPVSTEPDVKSVQSPANIAREPSPPISNRSSSDNSQAVSKAHATRKKKVQAAIQPSTGLSTPSIASSEDESPLSEQDAQRIAWEKRKAQILKNLPDGVDAQAAAQILTEIVVKGDEVHWQDVAGLEAAKATLREAVVYPFLRPDLFMGLREPARGILLFGPPGTGKTMLARAVATESKSTFFSISASSLTSKYLGESEKLVRALFTLAKTLAPSIIFVDEIDSLMGSRSGSGENEATRRIKTEFLIQWSALQKAAVGRESEKEGGDPNRVLVLAATNLPWAIDEAARRRFVRRQYIPLPDKQTRRSHISNLLSHQKQNLSPEDESELTELTDGFSGSDLTALAKDAAMGPLRSLGEAVLTMSRDDIPPISFVDFKTSLTTIRPSVSKDGLKQHEDWAREFGERGG